MKVVILPLLSSLSWKQLQIGMGMLPITTSISDELFSRINIVDFERLWTFEIKGFIGFCDLQLQRTLREWTAMNGWRYTDSLRTGTVIGFHASCEHLLKCLVQMVNDWEYISVTLSAQDNRWNNLAAQGMFCHLFLAVGRTEFLQACCVREFAEFACSCITSGLSQASYWTSLILLCNLGMFVTIFRNTHTFLWHLGELLQCFRFCFWSGVRCSA